jgi:microcystin-dependent protein
MSDPFVAEIRIFPFNFAPRGWAMCNGQLLPLSENTALFSLLGTTYGGDGKSTFGLPDLEGSVAMHATQYAGASPFGSYFLGETGGEDYVTLLTSEMASHNHNLVASTGAATATTPGGNMLAAMTAGGTKLAPAGGELYTTGSVTSLMNPAALSVAGSNQPHNNMMPYLTLNFCIALQGIYPPRGAIGQGSSVKPGKVKRPAPTMRVN